MVRYPVDVRASINTDTLDQDVKPIGSGPSRANTGIERDGGLTNLYRQDVAVTANAKTIITDSGKTLQIGQIMTVNVPVARAAFPVALDGVNIGMVPALSITSKAELTGYYDACISADQKILAIGPVPNSTDFVAYYELDLDGNVLNTRSINLWVLGGGYFKSFSIVRNRTQVFADLVEIIMIQAGGAGGGFYVKETLVLGAAVSFALTGAAFPEAPYVYKYEAANKYLMSSPGDNRAYVGDVPAGGALAPFVAKYFVVQRSGGFSRHIVTKTPALNGGLIECVGLVGHNGFAAAFTAAPAWQTPGGMAATAVDTVSRVGYGGVEAFYTQGGAIRSMSAPQIGAALAAYFTDRAAGDNVPIDYFGQLTGNFGVGDGTGACFRMNIVKGVQSFLSVTQTTPLGVGKMISTFGEIDPLYTPSWYVDIGGLPLTANNTIAWKNGTKFYAVTIGLPDYPTVEKVARDVYRINTLGLFTIIDTARETFYEEATDYHGQCTYTGGAGTARTLYAFKRDGEYGSTIDAGERAILSAAAVVPVASYYERYGNDSDLRTLAVAEYRAGLYYTSWAAPTFSAYLENNLVDTVYLSTVALPVPIGAAFDERSATLRGQSFIRVLDKPEYLIGNKIAGVYDFFELFGNLYAYNEGTIWLAPISATGYVQTFQPIARGQSLNLIATAPTMIYFYSPWDNSLYSFDGGRALVKGVRMNQLPAIIKGEWNVAENSLTLDTASTFIFVRDGVVSSVAKNADQVAGVALWSADDGVHIVGTANRYKYNYNAVGTVQPLAYRSAFFGLDATKQAYLSQGIFTIYSPTKAALVLKLVAEAFDMDGYYYQDEEITVNPGDYSASGYYRARIQPGQMRGLGCAVGLECSSKIVLLDVAVEINETMPGTVAAKGSV